MMVTVFRRDSLKTCGQFLDEVYETDLTDDIECVEYKTTELTIKCVSNLLGIDTHAKAIGFTIAIPSKAKIPTRIKRTLKSGKVVTDTAMIAYQALTPHQQYEFLIEHYVPHVVTPFIDVGVCVPELTQNNNVHLHILGCDKNIVDEYDMKTLRCQVGQCLATRKLTKNNNVNLNYIHYLQDVPKWIEYLQKDRERMNNKDLSYYVWKNTLLLTPPKVETHVTKLIRTIREDGSTKLTTISYTAPDSSIVPQHSSTAQCHSTVHLNKEQSSTCTRTRPKKKYFY